MKKKYITPEVDINEISVEHVLMAGSETQRYVDEEGVGDIDDFGGDSSSSKGNSFWDDWD